MGAVCSAAMMSCLNQAKPGCILENIYLMEMSADFFGMGAKSLALVNAIETAEKLAKTGLEVKINEKPYEEVRVQTRNLAEAAFML